MWTAQPCHLVKTNYFVLMNKFYFIPKTFLTTLKSNLNIKLCKVFNEMRQSKVYIVILLEEKKNKTLKQEKKS